ncbi:clan AA aspartic protease [Cytobacillus suaedae]|nr:clan AA aspartic protease [Cytobacillus suaedae]
MKEILLNLKKDNDGSAEILVEGRVVGNQYCFLLDTGSAKSSIKSDDYLSTFPSVGTSIGNGVFSSINQDEIIVPSLEVGQIKKNDFPMVRSEETLHTVKNLIGMDFLKDFRFHFYFDQQRVVVDEVESLATYHELVLGKKYHPYVSVCFGPEKANAVWDTGAGMTVVDLGFIKNNPGHFQEIGSSMGTDSTGTTRETPMFLMQNVSIGNNDFPAHRVVGVDLSHVNASTEIPMDLILGYTTLSKANWFFDFPKKKWSIIQMIE